MSPEYPLTRVSKRPLTHYHGIDACDKDHDPVEKDAEKLDPVMLAHERDSAWEMQKHWERKAVDFERSFVMEKNFRKKMEIKAEGFDKIRVIMARPRSPESLKQMTDDILEVVKKTTLAFERMVEALKEID